ncbi:MAG: coenzyme F420-0:L-glutamate ligase [Candidatus Bathyarchaeota archaeon]|jgi:coenzyme F420-0:L-glutamate ligase/coenzyme F420-1:gamma-L-glutamate ligase|nr:coenzyme F420-0:L-glutamate ligase [Candidatus Bathyarchaeota archaeon A05DMB-5]MDH7557593.1 coenzyme F420-0:L-glutamate ligase [Candidatus Bathyarchaeota archaeon]
MSIIQIIGINGLPIIKEGDNLAKLICEAAEKQGTPIRDGDILVVTHVIASRAEGKIVNLDDVVPSEFAKSIAAQYEKDPAMVEVVLRESKSIKRMGDGKLITETKHGFVCANSGVDKSNVPGERIVALLPDDADASAERIRQEVKRLTGYDVAVIISDTHGRPLREGEINVAIGVAGIKPIRDRRGEKDLFGYVLRVKQTAVADELCSAAELVIGQADEAVPVAIIRGYKYQKLENAKATELIRPPEKDLFL